MPSLRAPALAAAALVALATLASAHTPFVCGAGSCTQGSNGTGPYHLELGWEHEPPFVDERNSVHFEVDRNDANVTGIDGLNPGNFTLTISFGTVTETLPPVYQNPGEAGVYLADLIPTRAGTYVVHVTGHVDAATPVDISASLQEVQASTLPFPDNTLSHVQVEQNLTSEAASLRALAATQSAAHSMEAQVGALQSALWAVGAVALLVAVAALVVAVMAWRRPSPPKGR
ncbi:MAG: hypothetical protein ACYDBQ_10755 [Thermoplasmatota archaeon]